ncbi:unnamed protein product [Trifolium pratense]|uniref:Uncharacterized protein n=1 Tax=Trifolium pratense TaxID=57577 RepID=A0ACB0KFH1_TRIPR|nr:unnamed protein product [Trifolium pratense]
MLVRSKFLSDRDSGDNIDLSLPVTDISKFLTNIYLTSVLMILAPKAVKLHHAETAGIVSILFLALGLASGSIIAWFWVI